MIEKVYNFITEPQYTANYKHHAFQIELKLMQIHIIFIQKPKILLQTYDFITNLRFYYEASDFITKPKS